MTTCPQTDHAAIARQNDAFRRTFGMSKQIPGKIVMTPGIADLDALVMMQIQSAIILFNDFQAENDPFEEHDFGAIKIDVYGDETTIWFKIDLYDPDYRTGSQRRDDPTQTRRVMTILLPSEY